MDTYTIHIKQGSVAARVLLPATTNIGDLGDAISSELGDSTGLVFGEGDIALVCGSWKKPLSDVLARLPEDATLGSAFPRHSELTLVLDVCTVEDSSLHVVLQDGTETSIKLGTDGWPITMSKVLAGLRKAFDGDVEKSGVQLRGTDDDWVDLLEPFSQEEDVLLLDLAKQVVEDMPEFLNPPEPPKSLDELRIVLAGGITEKAGDPTAGAADALADDGEDEAAADFLYVPILNPSNRLPLFPAALACLSHFSPWIPRASRW